MKRVIIIFLAVLMWGIGFLGFAGIFGEWDVFKGIAFTFSFAISWPAVWWWMAYFKKELDK